MFYPEESLKKGGRFYLCWVADSWPLCFATITHRQLWSQDIRKICDDLLEVMNNESGRPASRFSLRLSSQLMRGLVRLYQRKVIVMLGDLCMINARVMKNSNKKFNIHEPVEDIERQLFPTLELPAVVRETAPEPEERVEEILQQSGNIVTNIQDITLKEAAIPDFQLPPNDGFGEENPLQFQDRTVEHMLGASTSGTAGHSGLEPAERPRAPRLAAPAAPGAHLEPASDLDLTLFGKSMGQELLPEEFEKDIPIPEIPLPDLPVPIEKEPIEPEKVPVPEPVAAPAQAQKRATLPAPVEEEIEDLEELEPPQTKRRRKNKLIVDKKTILPSNFLRARVENIAVELRCQSSTEDVADLRVPWDVLWQRPAAAGARFHSNIALPLSRMFSKNLACSGANALGQREMELALASRSRRSQAPQLEIIPEEPRALQEPQIVPQLQPIEETRLDQSVVVPDLRPSVAEDIADLPTQKIELPMEKIEALSQKRTASQDSDKAPKRRRTSGVISFRQHQLLSQEREQRDIVEKENISDNRQTIPPEIIDEAALLPETEIHADPEKRLTSLLQQAGLADMEIRPEINQEEETQRKTYRGHGSDSSETMLGSLDRTKVSLGDSEHTTDSKRFIRDQWGAEGTMVKILKAIKARATPVTVDALLSLGPLLPGCLRVIAARCFNSILKLKQHGFIKVHKDSDTLEIRDILLGPKFDIC